jgi:PAT family beta-lactamase induction signal transducer AmpG
MSRLTSPGFAATQYALLSSIFTLPGRLLASQSGRIVEEAARAAEGDGVLSGFRPLFAALPAESYATSRTPEALGTGYLVFFLYSAALAVVITVLSIIAAQESRKRSRNMMNV